MTAAANDRRAAPAKSGPGRFDLAVVGAGSAGFSAAITAAEQGARVALVGHGAIGGTCVNVGCIPSKTLIRAAETVHRARAAARFAGIRGQAKVTDWSAVVAQKDELVASLRRARYQDLLPSYDAVEYFDGPGRLVEDGVAINGDVIRTDKVIIATGARPAVPAIPGIGHTPFLTSTTALELTRLPRSLLVVGGGYIGCELAQMFARMGVMVTVVCRSRLLPQAEPEIASALTGYFRAEGIAVEEAVEYTNIASTEQRVVLTFAREGRASRLEAEHVLVATGRRPNTERLGLEQAGIALAGHGGIPVDDRMRTARPGIYAAGDVTGIDQFVYMAAYGARIAAENALNGDNRRYDAAATPSVVFTDPQLASVGLTEAAATSQSLLVRTTTLPLEYVPRALAARNTRGMIKLVADAATDRLLGAHILAPEGADSIQTAALAVKHGLGVGDLADMIVPYLTTVEGLKLAAQTFDKDIAKLSCCAG